MPQEKTNKRLLKHETFKINACVEKTHKKEKSDKKEDRKCVWVEV